MSQYKSSVLIMRLIMILVWVTSLFSENWADNTTAYWTVGTITRQRFPS